MKIPAALVLGLFTSLSVAATVKDIGAYRGRACVVYESGEVACWGANCTSSTALPTSCGILGREFEGLSWGDRATDVKEGLPKVNLGTDVRASSLAVGADRSCALMTDGKVKCWGVAGADLGYGTLISYGQTPGTMGNALPFVDLGPNLTVTSLTKGVFHSCAIISDGSLKCWGNNLAGSLGLENNNSYGVRPGDMGKNLPNVKLGTNVKAKDVCAGGYSTCALLDDNKVKCWGSGQEGALGTGSTLNVGDKPASMGSKLEPVDLGLDPRENVQALRCGQNVHCAILESGRAKCWGSNLYGRLLLGKAGNIGDTPGEMGKALPYLDVGNDLPIVDISIAPTHACAVFVTGTMKCWGSNGRGQLGYGFTSDVTLGLKPDELGENLPFVPVGTHGVITKVVTGQDFTCALFRGGKVKCWGDNSYGQLGYGNRTPKGFLSAEMGDNLPFLNL